MPRASYRIAAGLLAQSLLLVPLAGAGPRAVASLAAGGALAALVGAAAWGRLAPCARAALAMLAAGGLGMTLGWWADLGFGSAADALRAAPDAFAWCGAAPRAGPVAWLRASWMDVGMLAAGALAMRGARAHGGGRRLLADALAMVVGMRAGAALVAPLVAPLPAEAAVVAAHAAMNAGMLAGMQAIAGARLVRRRALAWRRTLPAQGAPAAHEGAARG